MKGEEDGRKCVRKGINTKKNDKEKQIEGRDPIECSVCKRGFYVVKLRLQNTRIFKIRAFEEKGLKLCTSVSNHKTFYHEKIKSW